MVVLRGLAALLVVVAMAGCYERPLPECSFLCGDEAPVCPDDYECSADGRCKLAEIVVNEVMTDTRFACDGATSDAGPDGSTAAE